MIYIETKTTFEKILKQTNLYFNAKTLYLISISVNIHFGRYKIKLQKIKIYTKTETTSEFFLPKKFLYFNLKDYLFTKKSVNV